MRVELSISSLTSLARQLKAMAEKVKTTPDEIIDQLLDVGETEAENNVLTGYAADGNTDIYVESVRVIGAGKLNMNGDDVAFQEFGYGMPGGGNPEQPSSYNPSNRDKWWFRDDEYGNPALNGGRISRGMAAQMPMYKASRAIREVLPHVVKDVLTEATRIV